VLGPTGRNFAAGMSGGVAFVHDPEGRFERRCNLDMVSLEELDGDDVRLVQELLGRHLAETGSVPAARMLNGGPTGMASLRKVMPLDYQRVIDATREALEEGRPVEDAIMAAAHG
jgi:glutamate synthase (NADPH/NADH) large chain